MNTLQRALDQKIILIHIMRTAAHRFFGNVYSLLNVYCFLFSQPTDFVQNTIIVTPYHSNFSWKTTLSQIKTQPLSIFYFYCLCLRWAHALDLLYHSSLLRCTVTEHGTSVKFGSECSRQLWYTCRSPRSTEKLRGDIFCEQQHLKFFKRQTITWHNLFYIHALFLVFL